MSTLLQSSSSGLVDVKILPRQTHGVGRTSTIRVRRSGKEDLLCCWDLSSEGFYPMTGRGLWEKRRQRPPFAEISNCCRQKKQPTSATSLGSGVFLIENGSRVLVARFDFSDMLAFVRRGAGWSC